MKEALKLGILGGGQLGRMLLQAAANYHVATHVLENTPDAPAALLCHHFTEGDICDYNTVLHFGRGMDVLTIEIENVNIDALDRLDFEGVKVIPKPSALRIIQDKGLQKDFYREYGIPTAPYTLIDDGRILDTLSDPLPYALKLRQGGYDGKGVEIIRSAGDFSKGFEGPCVVEQLFEIRQEIAVIVACNEAGEVKAYPPVEMVFDPRYNLVDYLISPANISEQEATEAMDIAMRVMLSLQSQGIFAVEMFIDENGKILVNETAPRAHNSGHQTIEGNYCSQYDMQMRVFQNLSPGDTSIIQPSLMFNLIGADGYAGAVVYQGLEEVMKIPGVYVHLYGKTTTKPGRKMGHITILGAHRDELLEKLEVVKQHMKVIAQS